MTRVRLLGILAHEKAADVQEYSATGELGVSLTMRRNPTLANRWSQLINTSLSLKLLLDVDRVR